MRNIILTIALLCSFVANAYEPMIREDRIWEYNYTKPYNFYPPIGETIDFKFEGTEIVNDKTYHKLLSWYPDRENQDLRTVALMREENKRVYILIEDDHIYLQSCFTNSPKGYYEHVPLKLEPNSNEMLLYDFTKAQEEDWGRDYWMFKYYEGCTDIVATTTPVMLHGLNYMDAELSLARVYFEDLPLEYDGKEWKLRMLALSKDEIKRGLPLQYSSVMDNRIEFIIEGIGNVGRGLLHRPYLNDPALLDGDYPYSHEYPVCFSKLMDLEGNEIFDDSWIFGSGVEEVTAPEQETDGASYDLSGKRVVYPEPGTIYIQDGKKHIAR